jgi:hypothetical protein
MYESLGSEVYRVHKMLWIVGRALGRRGGSYVCYGGRCKRAQGGLNGSHARQTVRCHRSRRLSKVFIQRQIVAPS